jgi:surface polysaccharide O-acyltransferase-like enzyme
MEYKERIVFADLLRITAAAAVVLLHTAASRWYAVPVDTYAWQIMNIYDGLCRWSVPIFVMVSGIFQLRDTSSPQVQPLSCKEEYRIIFKTRILRLIYALVFWGIFYNGYRLLIRHFINHEPVSFGEIAAIPLKIVFGPAWYHLWFIYVIMGLYLLTPLVRIFIAHAKKAHIKCFLILSGVIGSGFPFINFIIAKIPVIPHYKIYFPVSELSGYLGYYIAGYYFANNDIKKRTKSVFYFLAFISILITILGTSFLSITNKRREEFLYEYILPTTMFVSFGVFLLFKDLFGAKRFSQKQIRVLSGISGCALGIYLFHDLVLQIFYLRGLSSVSFNPLFSIPLISAAVFIISLTAVSLIKKIPILEKYIV